MRLRARQPDLVDAAVRDERRRLRVREIDARMRRPVTAGPDPRATGDRNEQCTREGKRPNRGTTGADCRGAHESGRLTRSAGRRFQVRLALDGRHLVRAAPVPGEQVLGAFDDDIVAEGGAEHVQLRPAEVLTRRGRDADRTMVLDEHEVTVVVLDHLGEVALVGADARQRFDARAQRPPFRERRGDTPRAAVSARASMTAARPSSPSARRTASSRSTVRSSWWSGNRSRARSVSAHTSRGPAPARGRSRRRGHEPVRRERIEVLAHAASVSPSAAASSPGVARRASAGRRCGAWCRPARVRA